MKRFCHKILYTTLALSIIGCAGGKKLAIVEQGGITADVAVGSLDDVEYTPAERTVQKSDTARQSIEIVDLQGNRIIMNAVADEQSGEMIATEELNEIVVEATFKHVAERNGMIDLVFELSVPVELQKDMWQVRFTPQFHYLGDTLTAERVLVTGEKFREVQNWGYSMYNNYMDDIVPPDSIYDAFARDELKGRFIGRNGDVAGADEHYRKHLLEKINANKGRYSGRIYSRFVKDPYPSSGVRIDSVLYSKSANGLRYFYVQRIKTCAGLKRVEMVMDGEIFTNGRKLCTLKGTKPLTFYISSISTLTDQSKRYLKKVISRNLHINTIYNMEFKKGEWRVDPKFSNNFAELQEIKGNIAQILENEDYVMDSILITASCSPEGLLHVNDKLSRQRGGALRDFVANYVENYKDSLNKSVWEINADESWSEEKNSPPDDFNIKNIAITEISEDWQMLEQLIMADSTIKERGVIGRCLKIADPDQREMELRKGVDFPYILENLYPKLRRVKFNFKLHRKGMLKDTVHTTLLDSIYMAGVEALNERDYKRAVAILHPYRCYNTAVAYLCMDYNNSALEILSTLPRGAKRDYMLALVHSRLGDEKLAVEYFLNSVEQDEAMRHRGNLDPEISELIKKYGIFNNL